MSQNEVFTIDQTAQETVAETIVTNRLTAAGCQDRLKCSTKIGKQYLEIWIDFYALTRQ